MNDVEGVDGGAKGGTGEERMSPPTYQIKQHKKHEQRELLTLVELKQRIYKQTAAIEEYK